MTIRNARSWRTSALVVLGLVAGAACSPGDIERPAEPIGSASASIVNGVPAGDALAQTNGVVYIETVEYDSNGATVFGGGTGTLLDASRVLTAGHVLMTEAKPAPAGLDRSAVSLGSITVYRGNPNDITAESRKVVRGEFHHGYDPNQDLPPNATFTTDVALLVLESPFTYSVGSVTEHHVSTQSIAAILSAPAETSCYGYGRTVCNDPSSKGSLNVGGFTMNGPSNAGKAFGLSSPPPATATGDSGGPCVNQSDATEIFGIIRSSPDDCSGGTQVVAAPAFAEWVSVIRDSEWSVVADFDGDGLPDTLAYKKVINPWSAVFTTLWGNGQPTVNVSIPLPASITNPTKFSFVGANFDAGADPGGHADLAVLVDGVLYSFMNNYPLFSIQQNFVSAPGQLYREIRVSDVNEDGYPDVEAVVNDYYVQVYFGNYTYPDNSVGLGPAQDMWALPSALGDDGRFVTLTNGSAALNTEDRQSVTMGIDVFPGQTMLDIQVFDGDLGGYYDIGFPGGRTCYDLWDLKLDANSGLLVPNTLVKRKTDLDFAGADAGWQSFITGPVKGTPYDGSGIISYNLEVHQVAGNLCNDTSTPLDPGVLIQGFKVRATAQEYFYPSDFSFMAFDAAGPAVAPFKQRPTLDTSFDGTFEPSFWVNDTTDPNKEVVLVDGDADIISDAPADPATRGIGDIQASGNALGANNTIQYNLLQPSGPILFTDDNPSGSFPDVEALTKNIAGKETGLWLWKWHGVSTENNIRMTPPLGSPARYPLFGTPTKPRSPSVAIPVAQWLSDLPGIASYLPVTLGSGPSAMVVTDVDGALAVLSGASVNGGGAFGNGKGKVAICHRDKGHPDQPKLIVIGAPAVAAHLAHGDDLSRPQAMAGLLAQLLVTELNVAKAQSISEPLPKARLYASAVRVGAVLTAADALVAIGDAVCAPNLDLPALAREKTQLEVINRGEVSYRALPCRPDSLGVLSGKVSLATCDP